MAFSDIFKLPLLAGINFGGEYSRNVNVRNADGSIAYFPSSATIAGPTTVMSKATYCFAATPASVVQISNVSTSLMTPFTIDRLRVENASSQDLFVLLVESDSVVNAETATIVDMFFIRAFEHRMVDPNEFAITDGQIAISSGLSLHALISTSPNSYVAYVPTGNDGVLLASKVTMTA